MKSWLIVLSLIYVTGCTSGQKPKSAETKISVSESDSVVAAPSAYTFKIIPSEGNTFGYDIYEGTIIKIHQPVIPGFQGNTGFKTEISAGKAARLVIQKIEKGQMPPTVSEQELKEAGAIE
jgi:hypothetical protein